MINLSGNGPSKDFLRDLGLPFVGPKRIFSLRYAFVASLLVLLYLYSRVHPSQGDTAFTPWSSPTAHSVQYNAKATHRASDEDAPRAKKVVETMRQTFAKYRARAWGRDDILPVSGGFGSSRNDWGAFIVDSSTTLALMGLWDEFQLEIDFIINDVDFTTSTELVDPFETTIRYLGALTSVIEMFDYNVIPAIDRRQERRDRILAQAVTLAAKLGPGFDSPTGMPWHRVDFNRSVPRGDPPQNDDTNPVKPQTWLPPAVGCARAGSNILEYSTLSKITGNNVYLQNATRSWAPLVWNKNKEVWPGIVDAPIDIWTGEPRGRTRSWDASHDSYYEYLLKQYIIDPRAKHAVVYRDRWIQAVTSLRAHMASIAMPTPGTKESYAYLGYWDNDTFVNAMSHFACFAAGNIMLGARHLGRDDFFQFGLDLLDGCRHLYHSSPTSIGPEVVHWMPVSTYPNATYPPIQNLARAQLVKHGFWASRPTYRLRPEYVESVFYAWRLTGDPKYRAWAWEAYMAIVHLAQAEHGWAAVADVMVEASRVQLHDSSQSFWSAETLKYIYLIFADSSVGNLDEWVFSTEAHPFRIRG
ncbi:MAG: hypothetical protein M1833_003990 [Piccolia ochrophora]|nr:MAG: hypothetical protein M1833_003990 [Piccolia ochrophora]